METGVTHANVPVSRYELDTNSGLSAVANSATKGRVYRESFPHRSAGDRELFNRT